jgi:two-component system, cell cycle response regulator DivK
MKPLSQVPSPAAVGPPSATPDRKPLVLLVEDLVDSRELYAQYLTYAGFSVVTAINGHEALRLAQLLRPDVILMDIRLPGMDGLEATADLKHQPELSHIPVVAITADSSREMADRCRAAGCASFIAKPALPDQVAQHVRAALANGAGSGTR